MYNNTQPVDFHASLQGCYISWGKKCFLELFLLFGLKYAAYCARHSFTSLVTSGHSLAFAQAGLYITWPLPTLCQFPWPACTAFLFALCLFYFRFPLQLVERCQLELRTEIGGVSCLGLGLLIHAPRSKPWGAVWMSFLLYGSYLREWIILPCVPLGFVEKDSPPTIGVPTLSIVASTASSVALILLLVVLFVLLQPKLKSFHHSR